MSEYQKSNSTAVMQRRHSSNDKFDYFGTPPWATRELMYFLLNRRFINLRTMSAAEPACGTGHMARVMQEFFGSVHAADIQDMGFGDVEDYLFEGSGVEADFTITNPPFLLAEQFIHKAYKMSRVGCAVLVRSAFAEGKTRHRTLFSVNPPSYRLQFVDRVVMHKGNPPDPDISVKTWDEKKQKFLMKKPSSATSYEWMVWIKDGSNGETRCDWIGTDHKDLTFTGDYDVSG